jgi:hypothetical protein
MTKGERADAASRAGHCPKKAKLYLPAIETPHDVKVATAMVLRAAAAGHISLERAQRLEALLNVWLKAHEAVYTDLAPRLDALEARLKSQGR